MTNAEEQVSAVCALFGKAENTMHLLFQCIQCSLVGEAMIALIRQASLPVQTYQIYSHSAITTFIMVRFHGSMLVWIWHGSKNGT